MKMIVLYSDAEFDLAGAQMFQFECHVDEADHKTMIDAASDAFWSDDERLAYADSFETIQDREDADERYEILAIIVDPKGVYIE